jgi:hypothetical protein
VIFRFYRGPASKGDSRAYLEIDREEGLLLRVDDDYYDCELAPAQALALARAILEELSS